MRLNDQAESFLARAPIQILGLSLSVLLALGGTAIALTRDTDAGQEVRTTAAGPTATISTLPGAGATSPVTPTGPLTPPASPPVAAPPGGENPASLPDDAFVFTPALVGPPAGSSPTSTPATPVALCTPAQVEQTLTTDKPAYNDGEVVNVTATIANRSSSICAVVEPDSNCYSLLAAYGSSDERPFWRSGVLPVVPCRVFPRRALAPGMSAQLTGAWDQSDRRECTPTVDDAACTQPRVPSAYMIRSSWLAQVISTPVELL